jgi:streptogrisin C
VQGCRMAAMTGNRRRWLGAIALITVGLGIGVVPAAAAAAEPIRLATQEPLDPALMGATIEYLTKEYGITTAEAMRRLELQRTSALLDEELQKSYPDSYGGMWLDHDNGGVLVVGATDPAVIQAALREAPDYAHMRVNRVARSLAFLQASAAKIMAVEGAVRREQTGDDPPETTFDVIASVDEVTNTVLVTGPHASKYSSGGLEQAHTLSAGTVTLSTAWPSVIDDACYIRGCEKPMRGGVQLQLYQSLSGSAGGNCTNGFNVRSSNGWQWTVTAGHCLKNANYTRHNGSWVGAERWDTFVGTHYGYDGAILPYVVTGGVNYATYWLSGRPDYYVFATGVSSAYPIRGMYTYSQIKVGWAACHTGAGYNGTRCGRVVGKDGSIRMSFATQNGDSGGPLFSQVDQRAYGILKGHSGTSGYTFYINTI